MAIACTSIEQPGWRALRELLWPDDSRADHIAEMSSFLNSQWHGQFVDYSELGAPLGFVEVSLRGDHVNGTRSSPVAFVEGLFVVPQARRRGVARALIAECERWALSKGCCELASDAPLENADSHAMHAALGFGETERVVFFRKPLGDAE